MNIDVNLLKELRERTGAGILDCKKALEANDSDLNKSVQWLREKGMAKAVKKATRNASEGTFNVLLNGNEAVLYEVNCETDFVAMNAKFQTLVDEIGEVLLSTGVRTTEEALNAKTIKGETLNELVLGLTAVVGEKITLRNVSSIIKTDSQIFGVYRHNGGKIAVVSVIEGGDANMAKYVSMSICANNPQYQSEADVDQAYLASEKEVLFKEAKEENPSKPDMIIEKMVEGRLHKELKEICLVDQPYIMDQNITVGTYLKDNHMQLISYVRKVVGEGVEKKQCDFAQEVMEQMK